MKHVRISPWALANHEFVRAFRTILQNSEPTNYFVEVVSQSRRAGKRVGTQLIALLIGKLILVANEANEDVIINAFAMEIHVPKDYLLFGLAVLFFGFVSSVLNFLQLNSFREIAAERLTSVKFLPGATVHLDGGNAWLLGHRPQFRFFRSSRVHNSLSAMTLIALSLPILLLMFSTGWYFFELALSRLFGALNFELESGLQLAVLLIVAHTFALAILHFVPFKFIKNNQFIRWNFLFSIGRKLRIKQK